MGVSDRPFLAGIVLGLIAMGLAGFIFGAILSPVTITKTTTEMAFITLVTTEYLTYTTTVKGDEADYIIMAGEVGMMLRTFIASLAPQMQRHAQGLITDMEMAELFERHANATDVLIELALKYPPPEKYLDDYKDLVEGLIQLKIGYQLMAQGLRLNDPSLKAQGAQLAIKAHQKLEKFMLLS